MSIRATLGGLLAALALAPAAYAAGPTPAFAPGPDGTATVPGGGFAIRAGDPCLGDFNGDGNLDAAVPFVRGGGTGSGVVVMQGDGTGHLGTPSTPITATANNLSHCASADLNGDGRDDLAAVEDGAGGIKIALGQANGTFAGTTI